MYREMIVISDAITRTVNVEMELLVVKGSSYCLGIRAYGRQDMSNPSKIGK